MYIKCKHTWRQANIHAAILRELQNEMAELNTKKVINLKLSTIPRD